MGRGFLTGVSVGAIIVAAGFALLSRMNPLPDAARPVVPVNASSAPTPDAAPVTVPADVPAVDPAAAPAASSVAALPDQGAARLEARRSFPASSEPAPLLPAEEKGPIGTVSPDARRDAAAADLAPELMRNAPLTPSPAALTDPAPLVQPSGGDALPGLPAAVVPAEIVQAPGAPVMPGQEGAPGATPQPPRGAIEEAVVLVLPEDGALPDLLTEVMPGQPDPVQGGSVAVSPGAAAGTDSAMVRNARAFANVQGRPLFSILLVDDGRTPVDMAALAVGDMALTLLIDPALPDAEARAAAWRDAGQEVAVIGWGDALPQGAEARLDEIARRWPGALALVEDAARPLSDGQVLDVAGGLRAAGLGLVMHDRERDEAALAARREGLASGRIFRDLDGQQESVPVIRRYLDRAAFKAREDGSVIVMGRMRPQTVQAVLEWALDGKASGLALAPLSAVLRATGDE